MQVPECAFCLVDQKRNPILKDGRLVFVVLSNKRLILGHTLVIPKRHVSTLAELSNDERLELFETAIHFQEKIKALWSLTGAGCDLSQHDRPFMRNTPAARSGLAVPEHLHIHLRPRIWQDEYYERVLRHETSMFAEPNFEELQRMVNLLGE